MNWRDNPQIESFLTQVESFNEQYNAVEAGEATEVLYHCFWSLAEIGKAEEMKEEWEVADEFVPFCGDWHDLFCVDTSTSPASVVSINDERELLYRWTTVESFSACLKQIAEKPLGDTGIIEGDSHLDF